MHRHAVERACTWSSGGTLRGRNDLKGSQPQHAAKGRAKRYHPFDRMNESPAQSTSRSLGRTVVAGLIVLLAGYVLLKIVIGIALAIVGPLLAILAVVALVWALKVLF